MFVVYEMLILVCAHLAPEPASINKNTNKFRELRKALFYLK